MNPASNDTLDIQPIQPQTHARQADAAQPDDVLSVPNLAAPSTGANDPAAADSARAKIAALGEPTLEAAALAAPVLPTGSAPPAPQPVSPAEAHHRQSQSKGMPSRLLPSRLKPILNAIASFVLILAVFKSPVLLKQVGYLFNDRPSVNEQIGETLPLAGAAVSPEPTITIPKINVNAPVVYEPSVQEAQIQRALQNGVVHYGTTARPGQPGNSVIVGHSSNDWWEAGNYKFVFVLLDKLIVGDTFSINYNGTQYIYEVTETKIVKPTDLSVLAPTSTPTVTLITCSPPGFSTNRLIIRAKQTSPAPGQTQVATAASPGPADESTLPGNAPSFSDQLGQAWSAFTETLGGLFGGDSGQEQEPAQTTPQALPKAL